MPYVVTSPISHLGRDYAAGDAIEIDPGTAHQLVAAKCVKEVPPPLPATKAVQPATQVIRKD